MKVGITGTPGTGKTSVGEKLEERLDWKLIKINEVVKEKEVYEGYDEKRDSYIVDEKKLDKILGSCVKKDCIIEGHLAHHYSGLDIVFVLRAGPKELRRRLKSKDWNNNKVVENVQAEILDTILQEATENYEKVYEIDTSDKSVYKVSKVIEGLIKGEEPPDKYKPGKVDWSGYLSY